MNTTATQLTITIPDGAPPGSILSIPVKGGAETIRARVPEGLGPGSTLVLTQHEGSDEWVEGAWEVGGVHSKPDFNITGPLRICFDQDGIPGGTLPRREELDPDLHPEGPVAYTVRLDTTAGTIDIIVRPDWAPHGARRFLELAAAGDLDGLAFYRAVKGCLAQFGLPARRAWPPLPDDPPIGVPFLLGAVCFAAVGKNSRKSTLFICIGDMSHCFGQSPWETPIGAVAEGSLDALDCIETIYGDIAECGGAGPDTGCLNAEGEDYLRTNFPLLTYINYARPIDWPPGGNGIPAPTQAVGTTTALYVMSNMLSAGQPANSKVWSAHPSTCATRNIETLQAAPKDPSHSATQVSGGLSLSWEPRVSGTTEASRGGSASWQSSVIKPQRVVHCEHTHPGRMPTNGPIDVPVKIVQSDARRRIVKDVPVEVCAAKSPAAIRAPAGGSSVAIAQSGSSLTATLAGSGQVPVASAGHSFNPMFGFPPSTCPVQTNLQAPQQITPQPFCSGCAVSPQMQALFVEQQAHMRAQMLQQTTVQANAYCQAQLFQQHLPQVPLFCAPMTRGDAFVHQQHPESMTIAQSPLGSLLSPSPALGGPLLADALGCNPGCIATLGHLGLNEASNFGLQLNIQESPFPFRGLVAPAPFNNWPAHAFMSK